MTDVGYDTNKGTKKGTVVETQYLRLPLTGSELFSAMLMMAIMPSICRQAFWTLLASSCLLVITPTRAGGCNELSLREMYSLQPSLITENFTRILRRYGIILRLKGFNKILLALEAYFVADLGDGEVAGFKQLGCAF